MTTAPDRPAHEVLVGSRVLALVRGDITRIPADAIVNAANSSLVGGGGVDGAIHRAGGPAIMAELRSRYGPDRRCPTGGAVVTGAGDLPARWVIHAVGPVWRGGGSGEAGLLASAYRASCELASGLGARTITFPAISTGVYGYPVEDAAAVALGAVRDHFAGETTLERATFVLFSEDALEAFAQALRAG
jgi:O-acetyl-ADP-ribose deacetylase (regulator of RNase III)